MSGWGVMERDWDTRCEGEFLLLLPSSLKEGRAAVFNSIP